MYIYIPTYVTCMYVCYVCQCMYTYIYVYIFLHTFFPFLFLKNPPLPATSQGCSPSAAPTSPWPPPRSGPPQPPWRRLAPSPPFPPPESSGVPWPGVFRWEWKPGEVHQNRLPGFKEFSGFPQKTWGSIIYLSGGIFQGIIYRVYMGMTGFCRVFFGDDILPSDVGIIS